MIRKRLTISVVVAVLVLSVVGSGAVTTGVLADSQADGDDSRESATAMATNSTETGALESEDVDWYAFDVEAGERIWGHLELGSNDSIINENKSARFDIFGPSGDNVNEYPIDMMGPAYRPNAGATMQALGGTMAEQSGTYYVRVKGTNITEYDLTIETQRLDGHDPNEQPATATPIESGETLSAVMSGPDRDTYAIDLEKDETIDVMASDVGSNLVNTQLLGPNASDATINGHHNEHVVTDEPPWATQLNHTANTSGTYFIHVYPFEEGIGLYDMEDRYELSVTVSGDDSDEQPSDDDNSRTNATELSVGTPGNGSIDSKTDADWYAIDLQEGQGFTAELTHMNREDPSTSIEFDVFGPDGDEIGESGSIGRSPRIEPRLGPTPASGETWSNRRGLTTSVSKVSETRQAQTTRSPLTRTNWTSTTRTNCLQRLPRSNRERPFPAC